MRRPRVAPPFAILGGRCRSRTLRSSDVCSPLTAPTSFLWSETTQPRREGGPRSRHSSRPITRSSGSQTPSARSRQLAPMIRAGVGSIGWSRGRPITPRSRGSSVGDTVLVLMRVHGRMAASQNEVELLAASVYLVQDGRVTSVEHYANRAEALEAVGCRRKTLTPTPEPAGYCAGDVAGERGGRSTRSATPSTRRDFDAASRAAATRTSKSTHRWLATDSETASIRATRRASASGVDWLGDAWRDRPGRAERVHRRWRDSVVVALRSTAAGAGSGVPVELGRARRSRRFGDGKIVRCDDLSRTARGPRSRGAVGARRSRRLLKAFLRSAAASLSAGRWLKTGSNAR